MPKQKVLTEYELLNEATDLFWKNGYHKTSIQDLVDEIGVNRASLYENYKDKGELFNECLQVYQKRIKKQIETIFDDSSSFKEGFERLFHEIVKTIRSEEKKGCMISNTYSELLPSPNEKTNKILDDSQNFWISTLEKQIKKAIKNQEVKSDINIKNIVQSMYATIVGVTILGKTNTSDKSLIESFHTHLSIFI